ncbi:MAG: DUF4173 domain-containing protein [Saccharofermentans sp.]|nr:DUF4173 domain-containing protein [Saccharofermentans sp.]
MDNKITLRRAGLMLAYPLAYLYLLLIWPWKQPEHIWIFPTIFSILFIAWNEIVLHGRREKTDRRSFFWYAVMVLTSLTSGIAPSFDLSMLGIHLCAIYSVLISNDILVDKKTGSYIWLDLARGAFVGSFANMGEYIIESKDLRNKEEGQEKKKVSFSWIIPVLILLPFFIVAMVLLSKINSDFEKIIEKILTTLDIFKYLRADVVARCILRLLFACPVCLFLYGLVSGSSKSNGDKEREAGKKCQEALSRRRNVSSLAMSFITGLFAAMYILFFVVEFRYIFGGLMGMIPDGFNVVDYARRGFFELVGIMAINMLVYVVVNIFERRAEGKGKVSKGLMALLMTESILFAVVSLSKLLMYFNTFGYTPKRMLAMWGTVILAAAAVTVIISVIKGKNHVRAWIIFTAASYVLMSIISGVFTVVGYHGEAGLTQRGSFTVYAENQSSRDIGYVELYADGEMVSGMCNADGSPVISSGSTQEFTVNANDLPDGSTLKDSELEFRFYDQDNSDYMCNSYTIRESREEDQISTVIVLNEYRTSER